MPELPILLLPEKTDPERDRVADAWTRRGGAVRRLGRYWIKDEALAGAPLAIYGNQTFSLVLAQIYGLSLRSPDDTLIARVSAGNGRSARSGCCGWKRSTQTIFPYSSNPLFPSCLPLRCFRPYRN